MIIIKNQASLEKMAKAGHIIATIFEQIPDKLKPGVTALEIDNWIDVYIQKAGLISATKGYKGYRHASCISVNDEVVHGVPRADRILQDGDLVSIDICASWQGYHADAARSYQVGTPNEKVTQFIAAAQDALDEGISKVCVGNRLTDISNAIQKVVERRGYGVIRDFAGHGIGRSMHEDPEILNYGPSGRGPVLRSGMAFAIEPMITMGNHRVFIDRDGWTAKTFDKSLAAHVEDTVVVTDNGPQVLTRKSA